MGADLPYDKEQIVIEAESKVGADLPHDAKITNKKSKLDRLQNIIIPVFKDYFDLMFLVLMNHNVHRS